MTTTRNNPQSIRVLPFSLSHAPNPAPPGRTGQLLARGARILGESGDIERLILQLGASIACQGGVGVVNGHLDLPVGGQGELPSVNYPRFRS